MRMLTGIQDYFEGFFVLLNECAVGMVTTEQYLSLCGFNV